MRTACSNHNQVTLFSIPLAGAAPTPAQAKPQAAARVSRPTNITPKPARVSEPRGDYGSFIMIDHFGNDAPRAESAEVRTEDGLESLSDYIVVEPQNYREMKEKARKEHEQQKAKRGKAEDIDRMKEQWERQYEEERIKSIITERGALQRKNEIEAKRQELKDSGEFFMHWLKASCCTHSLHCGICINTPTYCTYITLHATLHQ